MRAALFVYLVTAILVPPRVASAQSVQQPPPPVPPLAEPFVVPAQPIVERAPAAVNQSLRIPVAVWTASVAADQMTTFLFSSRYPDLLHEKNVLIRGLDRHPALIVAAGTAIDATTGWAAHRLLRGHPRLAKAIFYGAAAYRSYLAIYNIRMMRRAQAIRLAARGSAIP